ncbi:macrophage mannose receptor 1-like [Megalobrama amblycephala]|uniref:macrophage mannose receptor 1-like n=1 Tax=Megalobrama amblycephala TaxID=75352 RepID=UPI00201461EC|nr:macrophage mannose receptor 1-like [Megalobrama amblycephala]
MNLLYVLLLVLWSAFNSDSNSSYFLIYNEDQNKCVYAVSATEVQNVPCDASFKAQRFQWISSSQIISLAFNLCLGAEKFEDWATIILLPCNELSPVQTWECKNETLFGLKNKPLHLNYGYKEDKTNMVLFNGTGPFSRWLIYGTKENLCSHGYQVLDHHREGVSLFYICFSSFIAVGLVIMTAAVIMTTIRSKAKDAINSTTTVTEDEYMDA